MKIKLANYLSQKLTEMGITECFTITGGGAMHLNDALGHQKGLHCTYNHHEQACAMAAEAYARIHNRIAAVCVTTGPGGINALNGVAGGFVDSIPMMIFSGQVRYDTSSMSTNLHLRAMGDQEYDIVKSVDRMTKYAEMIIDPMRIRFCMEKMFFLAMNGRPGPCWLDIPLNVQASIIETDDLIGFDAEDYKAGGTGWSAPSDHVRAEDFVGHGEYREKFAPKVTRETAKAVIDKIRSSERPVINAGNGIRIAGAHDIFMKVVDKLGIPVVTGADSIDCIWDEHPLSIGKGGNVGDRPGNFAIQNSDLVLSLGSRLSFRQVGYRFETWARAAYVICNDIDAEELKKPTLHVDMPVHADVKDLLTVMDEILTEEGDSVFFGEKKDAQDRWLRTCQEWKKKYPVVTEKHMKGGNDHEANVYAFAHIMSSLLEEDQIVVVGNGSANVVCGHGNVLKKGQRFISNSGMASMGYGLPASIGCCIADHTKDVILITGDGSLQMNLQELQTVIGYHLPIKIFMINNQGYHSIRQTQKNFFGEPLVGIGNDSHDVTFPDMSKLAPAYGFPYVAIHSNAEIEEKTREFLAIEGPAFCEVFVTIDQNFEPKASSKKLPDGSMMSAPLEDLAPFLPEEEMDEIMIIPRIRK
ncbi:acetolactate synthase-1/2/3 large subunit [[Clostridium] aminophilum]|uniref:Acetolactate synthase-1/2/3 large subunit n=1 Tax=[Clostridium] aminophilum TaxID=1526 RepID=A0A1I0H5U9_9FIRM|nr:thiamine pyrophosphate-binding protein [[Clostridium] aminophilum]SET79132.1 acetolactate synthase-1/2/3 large subunit [[Clostridium] aminophilum]